MLPTDSPITWAELRYVATVVGILAFAVFLAISWLTDPDTTATDVAAAVIFVSLPATAAYEYARRRR